MSEAGNPFAPPQAQVADVEVAAATQPVKLWSAQGRIGRLRYLAYNAGAYFVAWFFAGIVVAVAALGSAAPVYLSLALIAVPLMIVFLVFSTLQLIKRCHDLGWNGWLWLLSLVPVVNLFFFLPVVFMPGRKSSNAYGAPPPPNRWFHWVLGSVLPVVMLVGILAAIAIPAYQGYAERARASAAAEPR